MSASFGVQSIIARERLRHVPLLSCITTTFNDTDLWHLAARSILDQTFEDIQYIVVDDGSDPAMQPALDRIDDPRLTVIRQANDGLSGARNKGLEQVAGDYVCFLDADDTRPAWAFASIARVLERDRPDVAFCRGLLSELRGGLHAFYDDDVFERLDTLAPDGSMSVDDADADEFWQLAQRLEPQSANKVVRTDFLRKHLLGFPNTHFFEDIFFHTRVLAAAQCVSLVSHPCFTYHRCYRRPQITASSGDMRFDIVAVTKLTLESFARTRGFKSPGYRLSVLASCFRLIDWCRHTISHQHRSHFETAERALFATLDPGYAAALQCAEPGKVNPRLRSMVMDSVYG